MVLKEMPIKIDNTFYVYGQEQVTLYTYSLIVALILL
jgi:hypothetical protein